MNPTADALSLEFPVGEDEIPMVGIDVYPLPSLFKNISLIYPLATVSWITAVAVAVLPTPINLSVVI